jgi:ABC-2 type transport system ATP-binding protein
MTAISIDSLSYSHQSAWTLRRKVAVHPFSLEINEGESFGFLGHNGAGKTTTIKCILDLIKIHSGTISLFGIPHTDHRARSQIGYIPEHPYFYDHLTVRETLALYGDLYGLQRSDRNTRVTTTAERVGIGDRLDKKIRSLSKGLMQRVALAQAIIADPKLLILDEPFSGLDPMGRRAFREIFTELKSHGTTLFIASHILSDIEHLCDRASIMSQGKLLRVIDLKDLPSLTESTYEITLQRDATLPATCTQSEVSTTFDGKTIRLTFPTRTHAESALAQCMQAGIEIVSFAQRSGTLEELFVSTIKKDQTSPDSATGAAP